MAVSFHSVKDGPAKPELPSQLDFAEATSWAAVLPALSRVRGISDIFITSRGRVRVKADGDHRVVNTGPWFSTEDAWKELCSIVCPTGPNLRDGEYSRDGGAMLHDNRYRFSRVRELHGEEFSLRVLPRTVPSPQSIHIPPHLVKLFLGIEDGLIVFAGPTGRGKSTSIASLVGENTRARSVRVITIEDPIEYLHSDLPNGSTFSYREVGPHTPSFAEALKDALRMSPDIMVVGEIRDKESAAVALEASLTGHKVVTTTHGGNVVEAMQRFGDLAADIGLSAVKALAAGFRMCVAQDLLQVGPGKGRVALHEILTASTSVVANIRAERFFALRQDMESGQQEGMQTFEQSRIQRERAGLLG